MRSTALSQLRDLLLSQAQRLACARKYSVALQIMSTSMHEETLRDMDEANKARCGSRVNSALLP